MVPPLGPKPYFFLPLYLMAAAQRPLPIFHDPDFLAPGTIHPTLFSQVPNCPLLPEPLDNLFCLLTPIYSPYSRATGSVPKLAPLPDV